MNEEREFATQHTPPPTHSGFYDVNRKQGVRRYHKTPTHSGFYDDAHQYAYLTASFNAFPALNLALYLAGICIFSPGLCGFGPVRASL